VLRKNFEFTRIDLPDVTQSKYEYDVKTLKRYNNKVSTRLILDHLKTVQQSNLILSNTNH